MMSGDEQPQAIPLVDLIRDLEQEAPGSAAKIEAVARSYQRWIVRGSESGVTVASLKEKIMAIPRARILDEARSMNMMLVQCDGDLLREAVKDEQGVRIFPERQYRPLADPGTGVSVV